MNKSSPIDRMKDLIPSLPGNEGMRKLQSEVDAYYEALYPSSDNLEEFYY